MFAQVWSFTTVPISAPVVCDVHFVDGELRRHLMPYDQEKLVKITTRWLSVTFCEPVVLCHVGQLQGDCTGLITLTSYINATANTYAWDLKDSDDRLRLSVGNTTEVINGTIGRSNTGMVPLSNSFDTLRFELPPGQYLTADVDYAVSVPQGAVLEAREQIAGSPVVEWKFVTAPYLDPPVIEQQSPLGSNVPCNETTLGVVFDRTVFLNAVCVCVHC